MRTIEATRVLGALCCASAAVAQVQWNVAAPLTVPAPRHGHAMVLEPVSQRVLMFGGNTAALGQPGYVNELWQWTGSDWLLLTPLGTPPSPRAQCGLCADASGALLFGGSWRGLTGGTVVYGDTYRLQGSQWTLVANTGPVPRDGHAMVATPQGVLLFGGNAPQSFTVLLNDTWLWNGATWTQLSPAANPSGRTKHRMVFDTVRGVAVLFGGRDDGVATTLADTWEWNGSNWTPRASLHAPTGRYAHAMGFSPSTGKTVVFGGSTWNGTAYILLDDTWLWDGTDWQQAVTTPPPAARYETTMAFGPGNQGAILFGGYTAAGNNGGTHELREPSATVTSFGAGCPGPNSQVPSLAAVPGELPHLGTTFHFRVDNLPASFAVPILALGLSNTVAAGPPPYALPFDLGVLGWPGCQQLVSLDATFATASFGTHVDFPLAIPLVVALLGFTLHGQAIVFYPSNDVAVANGVTVVVGA
jgi:hypothetical protein